MGAGFARAYSSAPRRSVELLESMTIEHCYTCAPRRHFSSIRRAFAGEMGDAERTEKALEHGMDQDCLRPSLSGDT